MCYCGSILEDLVQVYKICLIITLKPNLIYHGRCPVCLGDARYVRNSVMAA